LRHLPPSNPKNRRDRLLWAAWLFALYTVLGLLHTAYKHLDSVAQGEDVRLVDSLVPEMTGAYGAFLLLPILLWSAKRFSFARDGWMHGLAGHAAACLAFSFSHTTFNAVSRSLTWRGLGLGEYEYGDLAVRYWMELPNDLVTYFAAQAVIHLFYSWRDRTATHLSPATPAVSATKARRLLIRTGKKARLLSIDEIDWAEAANNYVEVHSAGKTHLLRGTLSSLEDRLDPNRYLRINRSQIVRLDFIDELEPWFHGEYKVLLQDGSKLSWSRRYRDRNQELVLESL